MSGVVIGARFAGPTIRKEPDGRYEAVLPEPTAFEETLQAALIESKGPREVYRRGLLRNEYAVTR